MVDSQKCSDVSELSSSPPGPYHQEPYVSKPEERFKAPPILPPHLLQVILNKDTGISVSTQASARTILHGRVLLFPFLTTSWKAVGEKVSGCPSVLTARVPLRCGSGLQQDVPRVWVLLSHHTKTF
uniref:Uncharacterized protein n=1 Tax=Ursus americanus TaxID=9643 RepID=A0A452REW1_URSAM